MGKRKANRRKSDPGPVRQSSRGARSRNKAVLPSVVSELEQIKAGDYILVRNNNGTKDQSAWLRCKALGPIELTNKGKNVTVRFHPPNPRLRSAKNSNLIMKGSVSTNNGARIAVVKHSAASTSSALLAARDARGDVVKFGPLCENLIRSENHDETRLIDNRGTTPEEQAAQNRHEPLLRMFIKTGSGTCGLDELNPSLDHLMRRVRPEPKLSLHVFTPSGQFLTGLFDKFQQNVPGGTINDLSNLVKPFSEAHDWTVAAVVLGPEGLFRARNQALVDVFRQQNIADLVEDMLGPSCYVDFEEIVSASILLVNRDGVVIVPFTATHTARQREGVAHYLRNVFILIRNFFGGRTDTQVITYVIAMSNCTYGLFATRRNSRKLTIGKLAEVVRGDKIFDILVESLAAITGLYLFGCSDYISEKERPMPSISAENQSKIKVLTIQASVFVIGGPPTLTLPTSISSTGPTHLVSLSVESPAASGAVDSVDNLDSELGASNAPGDISSKRNRSPAKDGSKKRTRKGSSSQIGGGTAYGDRKEEGGNDDDYNCDVRRGNSGGEPSDEGGGDDVDDREGVDPSPAPSPSSMNDKRGADDPDDVSTGEVVVDFDFDRDSQGEPDDRSGGGGQSDGENRDMGGDFPSDANEEGSSRDERGRNVADASTECLAKARNLVSQGLEEITCTRFGPESQPGSAILVKTEAGEKAIIVLGDGGQCSFVAMKGDCLVVIEGEVQVVDRSKVRHYIAPTLLINVDGEVTLTNVGDNDAMVEYDMRTHAVPERQIDFTPIVEGGGEPGCLDCRACGKIFKHQGKYYTPHGDAQLEHENMEGCIELIKHKMKMMMDDLETEGKTTLKWRFSLKKNNIEQCALSIGTDLNHDEVVRVMKSLEGVTVMAKPIKFVAACDFEDDLN